MRLSSGKLLKRILVMLAVVMLLINDNVIALAESDIMDYCADAKNWRNEDGTYKFPVTPLDDDWNLFGSASEMREATQIPEEILKEIATEELIALIMDYPLLGDIKAFSSVAEGYQVIKGRFNGIEALLERTDCYTKLLEAYIDYEIPVKRIMDYDTILSAGNEADILNALANDEEYRELILLDCKVCNVLNILEMLIVDAMGTTEVAMVSRSTAVNDFSLIYERKIEEKKASEYFETKNPAELLRLLAVGDVTMSAMVTETMMETLVNPSIGITYYLYTPDGEALQQGVDFVYDTNVSYLDPDDYMDSITTYHAQYISSASTTFNCHSFAWLCYLYSDDYQYIWLKYPSKFALDSHFIWSSTPANNAIAYCAAHSARVINPSQSNPYNNDIPEPWVISKWDRGPMVQHYLSMCPYDISASVDYYTYEE